DPARLLDEMLGGGAGEPAAPAQASASEIERYIQKVVAPYLTPRIDRDRQAELVGSVDEAIGGQMRAILHHPRFQQAGAVWRGMFFLVRRLDTGSDLQLYLVDATKAELAADLAAADDLRETGLWRLLFEGISDGQPWGVLAGLYAFGPQDQDVG